MTHVVIHLLFYTEGLKTFCGRYADSVKHTTLVVEETTCMQCIGYYRRII